MRIVHVTHRTWPVIGGSERYVQEIARRQVLDGHEVTVIATQARDLSALWDGRGRRVPPATPTEYQGVHIRRLPIRTLPLGTTLFPALRRAAWLLSHLSPPAALPLARFNPWMPELAHTLARTPADLLFGWNIALEGLTIAVAREAARRTVPWFAVPLLHLGRARFYTMPHQLDLLRRARGVITQTSYERDFLLARGLPPQQVFLTGPGIDLAAARQADGACFRARYGVQGPLVLAVGNLGYDKGTLHLLTAIRRLWREGHRVTLVLVGAMQSNVHRALAQLAHEEKQYCHYLGEISEREKWNAMDGADVVAMPSRTESFGLVFLEAWARGKPVIGARAGAVPAVIDEDVDGLLVKFGDVPGLAAAIGLLLEDPARAAELGRRGQEKVVQRYGWECRYARFRAAVGVSE